MAAILSLIGIYVFFWAAGVAWRAIKGTARAARGKGSLSDNLSVALKGMEAFQVRFKDFQYQDNDPTAIAKEIQVKGVLHLQRNLRLGFVTSIFDNTSGKFEPVISALAEFQESKTYAYGQTVEVGPISVGDGFIGWVRGGLVVPPILNTPYGGARKLVALLRLVDLDNPPTISEGFHQKDDAILASYSLPFDYNMEGVGYREALELKDEAHALCIQVGVSIAMGDGDIDDKEGPLLQGWIKRILDSSNPATHDALRLRLNSALKDGYEAANKGLLSLSDLTERLAQIADVSVKYELVERCYEIAMCSDNKNLRIVEGIAKALNLDLAEIAKIRDIKLVAATSDGPIEVQELLGIDPSWDTATVKKHLRDEFQKWNNRVTALPEGAERSAAQRMLDAISQARKTYG